MLSAYETKSSHHSGHDSAHADHDDHHDHEGTISLGATRLIGEDSAEAGYEFHGSRWNGNNFNISGGQISWAFTADLGGMIEVPVYRDAVVQAFQVWEDVSDVDFILLDDAQAASADVVVGWSTLNENGAGDIIGLTTWTYLPSSDPLNEILEAQVEFDLADFPADPGAVDYDQTLFYATAVHEVGHVMGLAHVSGSDEIMNAVVAAGDGGLGAGDIAGVQLLYGAAIQVIPEAPEPPATPVAIEILGTQDDDLLLGEAGDDIILMRYGNDIAAGGNGADLFIVDGRYVGTADYHTIGDLDFDAGDRIAFSNFDGGQKSASSFEGLLNLVKTGFLTASENNGDTTFVVVQGDGTGVSLTLAQITGILPQAPEPDGSGLALAAVAQDVLGSWDNDTFTGEDADDQFLLRFGNDNATGGEGADRFIIDDRYMLDGDAHTITDLNFAEGDMLEFRYFADGGTGRDDITSFEGLTEMIERDLIVTEQLEEGVRIELVADEDTTITLDLLGEPFLDFV